jgi:hypothetical protein
MVSIHTTKLAVLQGIPPSPSMVYSTTLTEKVAMQSMFMSSKRNQYEENTF